MKLSVRQIAELIEAEIVGDPNLEIHSVAKIEDGVPGSISFLANPRYEGHLYTTQASAIIVNSSFQIKKACAATLLRVPNPYEAFTQILEKISDSVSIKKSEIETPSFVSDSSTVGNDVYIGAFSYVGKNVCIEDGVQVFPNVFIGDNVTIGKNSVIYPHATIYHDTQIGNQCIIHSGACIGSDGFGFVPKKDGTLRKIPQLGNVILEDFVEIGANSTIDRATMGETVIKRGAKIDNLVQIAHNVEVGSDSVVAAQSGIAGSTKLGQYCQIGGQVGIVGHLTIANQTRIDAQSGVNSSIKETGQSFRGSPIQPYRNQLRSEVMFRKLEEMYKRIHQLEVKTKNIKTFEGK